MIFGGCLKFIDTENFVAIKQKMKSDYYITILAANMNMPTVLALMTMESFNRTVTQCASPRLRLPDYYKVKILQQNNLQASSRCLLEKWRNMTAETTDSFIKNYKKRVLNGINMKVMY